MEDTLYPEDTSPSGKRKRSPVSLVPQVIPQVLESHSGPLEQKQEHLPIPKRIRLPPKPSFTHLNRKSSIESLPSSLTKCVLSHLDPVSLTNLIGTNRHFRSLLDERYSTQEADQQHELDASSTDVVWANSRRRHIPTMPKPQTGLSERAQISLAFGHNCQFCGRSQPIPDFDISETRQTISAQWKVQIIWPFHIRACTDCLAVRTCKVWSVCHHDMSNSNIAQRM